MKLYYKQQKIKFVFLFLAFVSLNIFSQESLRLLSWNIQNFGQEKTTTQIEQIASVICDYDLIAIQQIDAKGQSGEKAVNQLLKALNQKGEQWEFALSKPTKTIKRNQERYGFLWKINKIQIVNKAHLIKPLERKVKQEPFLMTINWKGNLIDVVNYHAKNYKKHPEKEIPKVLHTLAQLNNPYLLMGSFSMQFSFDESPNLLSVINHQNTFLRSYCKYGKYAYLALDNICYTDDFKLKSSGVLDYVGGCENVLIALRISYHLPVVAQIEMNQIFEPMVMTDK
jgi:endonuclease/exonuclease/phosphatase family metal-dependent hydrolase